MVQLFVTTSPKSRSEPVLKIADSDGPGLQKNPRSKHPCKFLLYTTARTRTIFLQTFVFGIFPFLCVFAFRSFWGTRKFLTPRSGARFSPCSLLTFCVLVCGHPGVPKLTKLEIGQNELLAKIRKILEPVGSFESNALDGASSLEISVSTLKYHLEP